VTRKAYPHTLNLDWLRPNRYMTQADHSKLSRPAELQDKLRQGLARTSCWLTLCWARVLWGCSWMPAESWWTIFRCAQWTRVQRLRQSWTASRSRCKACPRVKLPRANLWLEDNAAKSNGLCLGTEADWSLSMLKQHSNGRGETDVRLKSNWCMKQINKSITIG